MKKLTALLLFFSSQGFAESIAFKSAVPERHYSWIVSVILLAVAGILLYWFTMQKQKNNTLSELKVKEKQRISPHTHACILHYREQELLIVENARQITVTRLSNL